MIDLMSGTTCVDLSNTTAKYHAVELPVCVCVFLIGAGFVD